MRLEARKLLFDVREAGRLIARFTAGRAFPDYAADPMLRSAVERQFEIMGEAFSKLARIDPEAASRVADHRRIIAFRNLLIHGYDAVQDEVVWGVVETQLPRLLATVEGLLVGSDPPVDPPGSPD
jgi:uncharacterized protein with HEPN domain